MKRPTTHYTFAPAGLLPPRVLQLQSFDFKPDGLVSALERCGGTVLCLYKIQQGEWTLREFYPLQRQLHAFAIAVMLEVLLRDNLHMASASTLLRNYHNVLMAQECHLTTKEDHQFLTDMGDTLKLSANRHHVYWHAAAAMFSGQVDNAVRTALHWFFADGRDEEAYATILDLWQQHVDHDTVLA